MKLKSTKRRSIDMLEADGWLVGDVEKWVPHTPITQDLFGFADLLACRPGDKPTLIQVTVVGELPRRRAKILAEPRALVALKSGFRIVLHGWRSKPTRTSPHLLRDEEIFIHDFPRRPARALSATRAVPLARRSDTKE